MLFTVIVVIPECYVAQRHTRKKAINMRSTHQNHRRSDRKKPDRRWHSLLPKNLIILQQSAQCINRLCQLPLLVSEQQRTEQAIGSPLRSTDHKQ